MNKKSFYILIAFFGILFLIFLVGFNKNKNRNIIGGEKDEHGCLGPAGYSWCPSTQKCQRMWEEYCEEYKDQFRGNNGTDLEVQ